MKKLILKSILISTIIASLSGCSGNFLNEGATRVRISTSDDGITHEFKSIYFKPSSTRKEEIKKGEYFSISLLSAYICGFRESRGLDILTPDGSNPPYTIDGNTNPCCTYGGLFKANPGDRKTRGEISLVANAGESSNTKSNIINPEDAHSKGRIIYYNDDIRESGQLINAINLPIYGPTRYGGKNVIFDLWMLELDNTENEKNKALLGTLAQIGSKAYPPSAPILGVLNTLGSAFLSGNQDDVEARFQMRFDVPAPANSNISRLQLAEGYYAFVREESRDVNPEWDKFTVNEAAGELCKSNDGKKCITQNTTYRDRTWFLIRIARESKESALDLEAGEEIKTFLDRLDKFESADINRPKEALNNLTSSLSALVCSKATAENKKKLACPE
jgi:hypothetical protein